MEKLKMHFSGADEHFVLSFSIKTVLLYFIYALFFNTKHVSAFFFIIPQGTLHGIILLQEKDWLFNSLKSSAFYAFLCNGKVKLDFMLKILCFHDF